VSNKLNSDGIIAVQDIILDCILSNGWKDYKNFARQLSECILQKKPKEKKVLEDTVLSFSHSFYSFNGISKKDFLIRLPLDFVLYRLKNMPERQKLAEVRVSVVTASPVAKAKRLVTIEQVFPEITSVDIATGKLLAESSLDIYERVIQNSLRDSLREKNATNVGERKSDSSLEVADIEDFTLSINGKPISFSAVVKGFKSVKKANIVFEDIAHQILKANETRPDHILLILAKPFADTVVSNLVNYGKDCGNRHLVVIMDTVNLARFLRVRKII